MKKVLIASALAFLMSSAYGVTAQTGVYFGGLLGASDPEAPSADQLNGTTASTTGFVWGTTLGFDYAINPNLLAGIELSQMSFGSINYYNESSANVQDLSTWGVQLMGTLTYLNQNGFNVFAKLGAIDEETDVWSISTVWFPWLSNVSSVSDWIPAMAVGVGYMPTDNWNISLQYEHTVGTNWNADNPTQTALGPMTENAFTLGVSYKIPV